MKVKIPQEKLCDVLSKVRNVVPAKTSLPIISSILVTGEGGVIRFTSTDLKMVIEKELDDCEIIKEGKITIRAHLFYNLISRLPKDEVSIETLEENQIVVKCGRTEVKYYTIPPDDFPPTPLVVDDSPLVISETLLLDMLKKVAFAVCTDESRYALTGVLMEASDGKFSVVATDGRRLSLRREYGVVSDSKSMRVTIPERTIRELLSQMEGVGDVRIFSGGGRVAFEFNRTKLISSLVEGSFPNYEVVIPRDYTKEVVISTAEWKEVLRRAESMKSTIVRFRIAGESLEVYVQNPEVGDFNEGVDVEYNGDEVKIGFNIEYLLDVVEHIPTDKVVMSVKDGSSPCVIKPFGSKDEYLNIIMPVRA
ncbi:MAG: DNA polymerase III subunit beta [Candidatus Hydrogenedentes bacterium]|nr:DNA polymerase III subunit beta [Candidatus Hydrogenedentota bacterium]